MEGRYKAPAADCPIVFKERLPGVFFLRDALFGAEEGGPEGEEEEEVYG